jgi:hypothetical protein
MDSELKLNEHLRNQYFKNAKLQLKIVFSRYPIAEEIEGYWGNRPIPDAPEEYASYLWTAMTTLGTEGDFKHLLPQLLDFIISGHDSVDTDIMRSKLEYVSHWLPEEVEAIRNWYYGYLQVHLLNIIDKNIEFNRYRTKHWLLDRNSELMCEFPYDFPRKLVDTLNDYLNDYLSEDQFEDIKYSLLRYPENDLDYIGLAHYLNYFDYYDTRNSLEYYLQNVFIELPVMKAWYRNIEKQFEEYFWKTSDESLKKLFSDALEKISSLGSYLGIYDV